jgi:hypothetical protein
VSGGGPPQGGWRIRREQSDGEDKMRLAVASQEKEERSCSNTWTCGAAAGSGKAAGSGEEIISDDWLSAVANQPGGT